MQLILKCKTNEKATWFFFIWKHYLKQRQTKQCRCNGLHLGFIRFFSFFAKLTKIQLFLFNASRNGVKSIKFYSIHSMYLLIFTSLKSNSGKTLRRRWIRCPLISNQLMKRKLTATSSKWCIATYVFNCFGLKETSFRF